MQSTPHSTPSTRRDRSLPWRRFVKASIPIWGHTLGRTLAWCVLWICAGIDAQEPAQQEAAQREAAQREPAPQETSLEKTTEAATSSEAPLYPSRVMRDQSLIAKAAGEQAKWLETPHGKIVALYRTTEAKQTHGALVLFHSATDPQAWPQALENLRSNLARFGWETLAVSLPPKPAANVPLREAATNSSATADPNATPDAGPSAEATPPPTDTAQPSQVPSSSYAASSSVPRELLVQANVDAAFQFLAEQQQTNVVMLVDNSAALPVVQQLANQLAADQSKPGRLTGPTQALVIVNLQSQEPLTSDELAQVFAHKQLPVLDVFFVPDTAEQKRVREQHRALAMRHQLKTYRQALLAAQPKSVEGDPNSFLAGRVRGFMQRYAAEKNNGQDD